MNVSDTHQDRLARFIGEVAAQWSVSGQVEAFKEKLAQQTITAQLHILLTGFEAENNVQRVVALDAEVIELRNKLASAELRASAAESAMESAVKKAVEETLASVAERIESRAEAKAIEIMAAIGQPAPIPGVANYGGRSVEQKQISSGGVAAVEARYRESGKYERAPNS